MPKRMGKEGEVPEEGMSLTCSMNCERPVCPDAANVGWYNRKLEKKGRPHIQIFDGLVKSGDILGAHLFCAGNLCGEQ